MLFKGILEMMLAVSATGVAALAGPRESVTFTEVDSVGLIGNPANQVRTAVFQGSDASGPYTAQFLTVSGSLYDSFGTSSWAREAVIEITPPGGQPFVCAPLSATNYVGMIDIDAGRYVLPLGQFSTAGTWRFRFVETYDDDANGTDQTWSTITFALDDGYAPMLPVPSGGLIMSLGSVPSDGLQGAGSTTLTRTFTEVGNVNRLELVGRLTTAAGVTSDNLTNIASQARIRITPPAASGLAPFELSPNTAAVSTASCHLLIDLPGAPSTGVPVTGTWSLEFYETTDEPGVVDAYWQDLSIVLQSTNAPVTPNNIRNLADGGSTVDESDFGTAAVPVNAGVVTWVRFDTPRDTGVATGMSLDIDMAPTVGTPQNDFSMGLYSPAGVLIARSYNDGPGDLPQISLGPGTRTRRLDGLPYDGANHSLSPQGAIGPSLWPNLPVGTSYLAVCSGDDGASFGSALWAAVPSTEPNGPTATVRVRFYRTSPSVTPANAQDLGLLQGTANGVYTMPADLGARFKWIKFTIFAAASDATGRYIDIDTANTVAPVHDTNIALYNSSGVLIASNNDIAPGWNAGNPTGGNSALSFGATQPVRPYSAMNLNMPSGNGRNGPLNPGTYYLQISECCAGFGADRFWVVNDYVTNTAVGNVNWAIRTNYQPACGFSDVGHQGGMPGGDSHLDNNDFIAFVSLYFESNPAADVGVSGGFAGHDGLFDNNDFVVFVAQFFEAPDSCR
ncbi:MAG: GC-type dockerin domain-anchored protein [Phycisphaerales bacterium]